jgi:hypothetical protein
MATSHIVPAGGEQLIRTTMRQAGIVIARDDLTVTLARDVAGEHIAGSHIHHDHIEPSTSSKAN